MNASIEEELDRFVLLQVEGACHKGAGKRVARIDTETMSELGLVTGDVVEIAGRGIASAIVRPGYSKDADKKIIRIGGNTRKKVGLFIGDVAIVRKATTE